ncbi:MAG: CHAP domain-containing protein [Clostridiales bacterium]|nr:CHAP domain-containing protein [Clostridiales bacterium]
MNFSRLCALLLAGALCTTALPSALAEEVSFSSAESSSVVETASGDLFDALPETPAPSVETTPNPSENIIASYEPFMTTACSTTGHDLGAWRSNGDGTMTAICHLCGAEVTEDCAFEDTVVEPTCLTEGYTVHSCHTCGYSYEDETVDPLGHSYVATVDEETGDISYRCERRDAGFTQDAETLAASYSDGRTFSADLVEYVKSCLAEKDKELNETLSPDEEELEEQDAEELLYYSVTKSVSTDETSDPTQTDSLTVSTDAVSVVAYLEVLAFQDEEMELTEETVQEEIDALYETWYQTSSQVLTLPNEAAYRSSEDYTTDLAAVLEAAETGTSVETLRDRVVAAAYGEIGNSGSKYINHYNQYLIGNHHKLKSSEPWCSEFATWCLHNTGVSTDAAPTFMAARDGVSGFKSLGTLHTSNYTPQPGDVAFFGSGTASHTALVVASSGSTFTTIEKSGNTVKKRTRKISSVLAFGEVKYEVETLAVELTTTDPATWMTAQLDEDGQTVYELLGGTVTVEEPAETEETGTEESTAE